MSLLLKYRSWILMLLRELHIKSLLYSQQSAETIEETSKKKEKKYAYCEKQNSSLTTL